MAINKFYTQIKNLIKKYDFDSIDDVVFGDNLYKTFIYTTDDYYLYEDQFRALTSILHKDEILYVAQMGYQCNLFDVSNKIVEMRFPFSYSEYRKIDLHSIAVLFSNRFEWILIIDESIEGGEGILAGSLNFISKFNFNYSRSLKDLIQFVEFSIMDSQRRNTEFNHLMNIFHLLK